MIRTKAESHFRVLDLDAPELSVLFGDDDVVRSLNEQWREEDETTDVLSFPMETPPGLEDEVEMLGDIAINLEYAERLVDSEDHRERVADELDVPVEDLRWELEDEVHFLFIHGLLHLVGYDHLDPDDEAEMKAMEKQLWRASRTSND
jgi:probable rRNA maturation factor